MSIRGPIYPLHTFGKNDMKFVWEARQVELIEKVDMYKKLKTSIVKLVESNSKKLAIKTQAWKRIIAKNKLTWVDLGLKYWDLYFLLWKR